MGGHSHTQREKHLFTFCFLVPGLVHPSPGPDLGSRCLASPRTAGTYPPLTLSCSSTRLMNRVTPPPLCILRPAAPSLSLSFPIWESETGLNCHSIRITWTHAGVAWGSPSYSRSPPQTYRIRISGWRGPEIYFKLMDRLVCELLRAFLL